MSDVVPDLAMTRRTRIGAVAVLGIVLFALALGAVLLRPIGSPTALFWPAAGVAVGAVLRTSATSRTVVLGVVMLATSAANLVGDRPVELAVLFGGVNTIEALVVAVTMGRAAVIDRLDRAVRFVFASGLGAVTAGVLAGGAVALTGSGSFAPTWWAVAASHGAAILLLAPIVLHPRADRDACGLVVRGAETALVALATLLVTWAVFRPGQDLPIAFLPMPLAVWAAIRLAPSYAAAIAALMTTTATMLTLADGGPFAAARDELGSVATTVSLVQVHAVATAVMVLLATSLTIRRRDELERVRRAESLYRDGWSGGLTGMLLLSLGLAPDGERLQVVQANPAAARLLGVPSPDELVHAWWCGPIPASDRTELGRVVAELLDGSSTGWRGELRFGGWRGGCDLREVGVDEPVRWMEVSIALVDSAATSPRFAVQMHDVTARREAEQQLLQQALHDHLTGLPNRALLTDRLASALAASVRAGSRTGLLLIDLDGFKAVNDSGGHHAGDEVLRTVASRLLATARGTDTVARLGGDEFVVLCGSDSTTAGLDLLAERIASILQEPVEVAGARYQVGASIGVVLSTPDDDPDTVLAHADHAMYRHKRRQLVGGTGRHPTR